MRSCLLRSQQLDRLYMPAGSDLLALTLKLTTTKLSTVVQKDALTTTATLGTLQYNLRTVWDLTTT